MKRTPFMRRQFVGQFERAVDRADARQDRRAAAADARRAPYIPRQMAATPYNYGRRPYQGSSRPEVKCYDVVVPNNLLVAIGSCAFAENNIGFGGITELNNMVQGASVYNRIGSKVCLRSVRVSFGLAAPASTAYSLVRALVIYDRQSNGAAPAIGDILAGNNNAAPIFNSDLNIVNRNRFIILRDQSFTIDTGEHLVHNVDWYIKTRGLETEYKANAGTIGDIATGCILFVAFWFNITGTAPSIIAFQTRIRYDD